MGLFPNLKIAQKLPLAVLGSALLVSAGVGIASYLIGSATVDQMSQRQMATVAAERANQFTTYPRDPALVQVVRQGRGTVSGPR